MTTTSRVLNRQDAVILDIRPPEAFAAGHIPGAIAVYPETAPTWEAAFADCALPADVPCVVVDAGYTKTRAVRAVRHLQSRATTVAYLNGGMAAWDHAGMPV